MNTKIIKCKLIQYVNNYTLVGKEDSTMHWSAPQYVVEAYNSGVREFSVELVEETILKPQFKQGLLEVTYEKPKKQNFTREEVIEMLLTQGSLTDDESRIEQWLDRNYR